jgi:putative salt-induced outer membrane protein YdiY
MKSKIAAAALILLPFTGQYALAEDTAVEESAFTVSAELGFLYKSGNTKSGDIKAGFNIKHEEGKWVNLLAFNALAKKIEQEDEETGKDEFESTDNKWDIIGQTNYSLDEDGKNYVYGSAFYQQDKFSSFAYQTSGSIGWGRHWIDNETSSLFADIGPGVKYDVIRAMPATLDEAEIFETSETAAIVQAQVLYTNQINDFVEFKQYFVAKQAVESEKNSSYRSETSLTTKLIESLQFKFSFLVEHDTEVEESFENTNTETSVTLIYSF